MPTDFAMRYVQRVDTFALVTCLATGEVLFHTIVTLCQQVWPHEWITMLFQSDTESSFQLSINLIDHVRFLKANPQPATHELPSHFVYAYIYLLQCTSPA